MTTMIHTSEQQQPRRLRFVFPVAMLLGVMVILLHALIIYVLPLSPTTKTAITDFLMAFYGFIAAGVVIYAALAAKRVSRRVGIAWLLVGIAIAMYACGDLIWAYIEVVLQENAFPSLADAAYLSFYVYFIAGIFILPARMLKPNERVRLILDMSIVVVSSLLLFWTLLFSPILRHGDADPLSLFVTLAYPSMDMVLLLGLIAIMLRSGELQSSHALLALSALAMVVADITFNVQMIEGTYVSGSLVDMMYVAQYVLAAWAGVELILFVNRWPNEIVNPFDEKPLTNPLKQLPHRFSFLVPYAWIALAFGLLVYEHFVALADPDQSTFNFVAVGLAIIIILVLIRQFIQLKETARLSADLTLLLESSRILASPFQSHDAPRIALKQLSVVLPFEKATIAMPKHDGTIQLATVTHADETLVVQPYRSLPSVHMLWRVLDLQKLESSESPAASVNDVKEAVSAMLGGTPGNPSMLSWMIAPLIVNDLTVGLVAVGCRRPLRYSTEHASLLVAFSRQAAAAIENARLRRHETQAAAASERSRLARELHDSVSQALYGVTLGIQTAQAILVGESPAREPLNYSLNLANGALAEMKALIFELRPETLATEGLVQALRKQTDALCKRHKIDARISAPEEEPAISLDAKEALYRITLEAVQNTIRHAQATSVDIVISQRDDTILLNICDNGRGFDSKATYTGHLGLISMRERAEQLGGAFEVTSELDKGTCIRVSVPMIEQNAADDVDSISLSSRRQ
jgi:signal transduction histidine kinase